MQYRICKMTGWTMANELWGQSARLAVLRFGQARYGRCLAESGIFRMPAEGASASYLQQWGSDYTKPVNHVCWPRPSRRIAG
jgi:hypothetical protein